MALTEQEFGFFADFALGGIQNPTATEADKKKFAEIGARQITVADAFNLGMVTANTLVNQGMASLAQLVTPALDAPNILATALIKKGIISQEDIVNAEKEYQANVEEYEAEIRKQAQEKQAQEVDELELDAKPKMTVVRNESEVDLSVKGK